MRISERSVNILLRVYFNSYKRNGIIFTLINDREFLINIGDSMLLFYSKAKKGNYMQNTFFLDLVDRDKIILQNFMEKLKDED